MRTTATLTGSLVLLTIGYALGASQILSPGMLLAQAGRGKGKTGADASAAQPLTEESKTKIKAAADALKAAMESLQAESRFGEPAVKGINAFAVLTGGNSSLNDLQSGGGVDPETFAALYAGLATDKVVVELGRDAEGKLTYKGRVVRMYPVSVIRAAYAQRSGVTGEDLLPTVVDDAAKAKAKKKADTEDKSDEE
jgi:hypothetical protein